MLLGLALKNLRRNFRRTLLAEISIVFGVIVIVFTGNFINGMQRAWAQFEINANTGAFEIEHRDYRELRKSEPMKVTIENADRLVDRITKIPGVHAAFGKLNFSGMVSNGLKSTFFDGVGVDVVRQKQTLPRQEDLIVKGKPLDGTPSGIILGSDLASMLELKIGDPVTIVVRTDRGALNLTYGTLIGTKNGRHFPSSTYLEMHLSDAQKLLRTPDRVSQVVVGATDFDAIPNLVNATVAALTKEHIPFITRDYEELIPIYARAIASFKIITLIVGCVLFVLVGGGIGNVIAMAVMERKKEIGTMRALGMRRRQIKRLFLAEGGIAGAIGAVVGLSIVTALTYLAASNGGLHMPSSPGNPGFSIMPQVDPVVSIFGVAMPVLVGVLAAWWPASTSASLSPIDALTET